MKALKKLYHLLPLCVLCTCSLTAQTLIKGKVTDSKKKPLSNANIFIKDSYDGTNSDSLGLYSFTALDTGNAVLVFTATGFENFEIPIVLDGREKTFNVPLTESAYGLQEVVITAGAIEASDEKKSTVLKPLDIVTTAGAQGDIFGALKTLPGTQQVGEEAGLFVRGGTNAETKTIIDGMIVNNPFTATTQDIAARARFSPFLFKGTVFSTGGYSSLYGQALSSVLLLETSDLPERSSATLGATIMGGTAGYNHLGKNKRFSAGGEINYFNLTPYFALIKQRPDWKRIPSTAGGSFNLRFKPTDTGIIKFYVYYNKSDFSLLTQNLDSINAYRNLFSLTNDNYYSILTYKEKIGKFVVQAGTSFSHNIDHIGLDENKIQSVNNLSQARLVISRELPKRIMLRVGGEHFYYEDKSSFNQYKRNVIDNYSTAFTEADFKIKRFFVLRLGGRMDHSTLLNKTVFAERASFAIKAGEKGSASVAYGTFYQKPETNLLFTTRNSLSFEQCRHYIVNYQYITDSITFRAEVYYKDYRNFVQYTPLLTTNLATPYYTLPDTFNGGNGFAQGLDVFFRDKKTFKGMDYWISYTFLDTKRMFRNYPEKVMPSFAATHTASLVLKKFWVKRMFGGGITYSFATGRPYYNPNNPKFMSDRTIPYHAVGINANLIRRIGKSYTVFVLAITNALGNKQVFGYRYSADGQRRTEINPTAPRGIFFGMFMSFGIDRTKSVIDNQ